MCVNLIDSTVYNSGFQWSKEVERPGCAEEIALALVVELNVLYKNIDFQGIAERRQET